MLLVITGVRSISIEFSWMSWKIGDVDLDFSVFFTRWYRVSLLFLFFLDLTFRLLGRTFLTSQYSLSHVFANGWGDVWRNDFVSDVFCIFLVSFIDHHTSGCLSSFLFHGFISISIVNIHSYLKSNPLLSFLVFSSKKKLGVSHVFIRPTGNRVFAEKPK